MSEKQIEKLKFDTIRHAAANLSVRHKSGATSNDYLNAFLPISRSFAYATQDDSWGEFEKEFGHIVCRLIDAEAQLATLTEERDRLHVVASTAYRVLAMAFNRIHTLPRETDSLLAKSIAQTRADIEKALPVAALTAGRDGT